MIEAFCDPGGIRTHDPQIRNLLLYPAELPDLDNFAANIKFLCYYYNLCEFFYSLCPVLDLYLHIGKRKPTHTFLY